MAEIEFWRGAETASMPPCPCRNLSLLSEGRRGSRGAHTQADWRQPQLSSAPGAAKRGVNPCWPRPPPPASLH